MEAGRETERQALFVGMKRSPPSQEADTALLNRSQNNWTHDRSPLSSPWNLIASLMLRDINYSSHPGVAWVTISHSPHLPQGISPGS